MSTKRITRPLRLAIACVAAGLTSPEGALVLGIPRVTYDEHVKRAMQVYRSRGIVIREAIHLVRAAEADGLVVKPERRT